MTLHEFPTSKGPVKTASPCRFGLPKLALILTCADSVHAVPGARLAVQFGSVGDDFRLFHGTRDVRTLIESADLVWWMIRRFITSPFPWIISVVRPGKKNVATRSKGRPLHLTAPPRHERDDAPPGFHTKKTRGVIASHPSSFSSFIPLTVVVTRCRRYRAGHCKGTAWSCGLRSL